MTTMERVNSILEEIIPPGFKVIYLTKSGSELHGTNSKNSDTDIKGIFVPSVDAVILKDYEEVIYFATKEDGKNSADDIDIELFSVNEFFRLLSKGEAGAVDILFSMFSPSVILETKESLLIKDNYKEFLVRTTDAFVGFAMKQASLYTVKGERLQAIEDFISFLENIAVGLTKNQQKTKIKEFKDLIQEFFQGKELFFGEESRDEGEYISVLGRLYSYENPLNNVIGGAMNIRKQYGSRVEKAKTDGIDYKAFSHAVRALKENIELLTTEFIVFPLTYAEELIEIKQGKITDVEYLSNLIEDLYTQVKSLENTTSLPQYNNGEKVKELKLLIQKENLCK